ncbi:hypothetical protein BH11ARM1_BH11ARM1_17750 [soil metagenome]
MNIDEQIQELKRELPADKTHDEAYRRLLKPTQSKRVGSWRWVAVGATCALLATPVLLRRPGNAAYANPFDQLIKATDTAPIIHQLMFSYPKSHPGKQVKFSEGWTNGSLFRGTMQFGDGDYENRVGQSTFYTRMGKPPYEYIFKREPGQKIGSVMQRLWLKDILKTAAERSGKPNQFEKKSGTYNGKLVDVYEVLGFAWDSTTKKYNVHGLQKVYADPANSRVLNIQYFSDIEGTKKTSETIMDYPAELDSTMFEVPAKTTVPRYYPEKEIAKAKAQKATFHDKTVKGETVRLFSATRAPGEKITVIWRGVSSGTDTSHPPLIVGVTGKPMIYKVGLPTSDVLGATFPKGSAKDKITVKIPVYRKAGSKRVFLGYATYPEVSAYQTLPHYFFMYQLMHK